MGSRSARDAGAANTDILHIRPHAGNHQQGEGEGHRAQQHGFCPRDSSCGKKALLTHPKRLQRFSLCCALSRFRHVAQREGQGRTLGKTQLALGNAWHHPWSHAPPLWLEVVWYQGWGGGPGQSEGLASNAVSVHTSRCDHGNSRHLSCLLCPGDHPDLSLPGCWEEGWHHSLPLSSHSQLPSLRGLRDHVPEDK